MEVEEAGAAAAPADEDAPPAQKRRAYDNVSGKVSHRPWKAAFGRHSSLAGRPPADWEQRMREKAQKKAIQTHVAALNKVAHEKAAAEKKRREDVKKKRDENRRSDAVAQKVLPAKGKAVGAKGSRGLAR